VVVYKKSNMKEITLKEGMKLHIEGGNFNPYTISKIKNRQIYVRIDEMYATYDASFVMEMLKQGRWKILEEKKVLGYKAPMNLYGGKIQKGQVVFPLLNSDSYGDYADVPTALIPKEIAETWEAVYQEEEKLLTLGDNNTKVLIKCVSKNRVYYFLLR
jgi:hypothetical protein